jgi:hypothetical protein
MVKTLAQLSQKQQLDIMFKTKLLLANIATGQMYDKTEVQLHKRDVLSNIAVSIANSVLDDNNKIAYPILPIEQPSMTFTVAELTAFLERQGHKMFGTDVSLNKDYIKGVINGTIC